MFFFLNETWMCLASEDIHPNRVDPYDSNCSIATLFKEENWIWMSLEIRKDGAYCALYKGYERLAFATHRFSPLHLFKASIVTPTLHEWKALNRLLCLENMILWITQGR